MSGAVTVELIPAGHKVRYPQLATETFAILHRVDGGEQMEILATDEDVPAGVSPDEYARRIAVEVRRKHPGTRYVPADVSVVFHRDSNGRWSAYEAGDGDPEDDSVWRDPRTAGLGDVHLRVRSRVGSAA